MNPYTGDLKVLAAGAALPESFLAIPEPLMREAEAALAGREHVRIDLRKPGPLQAWAKKKRKQKIAAQSRRRNRT